MNPQQVIKILTEHNLWRRGEVKDYPHSPYEIGLAIDAAIELLTTAPRDSQGLDETISDEEIERNEKRRRYSEYQKSNIGCDVYEQDAYESGWEDHADFIRGANFARKQQPTQVPLNELKDFLFNIHEVEDNRLYFTLQNVRQFISRYESGPVPPDLLVHDWTTQPVDNWIDVSERLPENIEGKSYSENVFTIEDGELCVMALCDMKDDDNNWCRVWCNCYGDIYGDPEFDDNYNPIKWKPLPTPKQ